ncbi:MAG: hypothetical protein VW270_07285 [Candidatus Poseidoniales archaeon]
METIEEWSEEKKAYVLYYVMHSNFGAFALNRVMLRIVNNNADVCVCNTCVLKGYERAGTEKGIEIVKYWANEYDLYNDL